MLKLQAQAQDWVRLTPWPAEEIKDLHEQVADCHPSVLCTSKAAVKAAIQPDQWVWHGP